VKYAHLLSIDYGTKKLGLARWTKDAGIIFPSGVIHNKGHQGVFRAIFQLVTSHNIELIVLGLPLGQLGQSTPISEKIIRFGKGLKDHLAKQSLTIDLATVDESHSTQEQEQIRQEWALKGEKFDKDEQAAVIIMKNFLSSGPIEYLDFN
jgi:putative Holliday junction resolvase